MTKIKPKYNILFLIFMYMIIYNPLILPFNCIHVIAIGSWIYLIKNFKYIKDFINNKKLNTIYFIIIIILLYLIFIAIINGNSFLTFAHQFYWIYGDIPFSLCVLIYIKKKNYDFNYLVNNVIIVSTMMSFTSLLALFIPSVKEFFLQLMRDYGVSYVDVISDYRNFGLAANLTSFTSMFQAVVAIICYNDIIRGNKKLIIPFLCITISAIINTRSSFIFIAYGFLIMLINFLLCKERKYIKKFCLSIILLVVAIIVFIPILNKVNPQTTKWLIKGYNQIFSLISGKDVSNTYFGELNEMTHNVLPHGIWLIVGRGTGIMGSSRYGVSSDVGFINDIWRGGCLYSGFIMCLFLSMLFQIYKSNLYDKDNKRFLCLFILGSSILTNIKGSFFIHSDLTVFFWIIYIFLVVNKENQNEFKIYFKK